MAVEISEVTPSTGRRRYAWGMALLLGAAAVSAGTAVLFEWATGVGRRERLVVLGVSEYQWILAGIFLYGTAAIVGFIMLSGPVLDRIRHTWVRWTANTAAFLVVLGAILVWLLAMLLALILAALSPHFKVTSPEGVSVIAEQGGYDPDSYDIYRQKSAFVYTWAAHTRTSRYEPELENCTLADGESELVLTCGSHVVAVPL